MCIQQILKAVRRIITVNNQAKTPNENGMGCRHSQPGQNTDCHPVKRNDQENTEPNTHGTSERGTRRDVRRTAVHRRTRHSRISTALQPHYVTRRAGGSFGSRRGRTPPPPPPPTSTTTTQPSGGRGPVHGDGGHTPLMGDVIVN